MHPIFPFKKYISWFRIPVAVISFPGLYLLLLLAGSCKNKPQPVAYGHNGKTGAYAAVNGIKLYYEIYGTGAPLVLLHGNGASIRSGRQQIDFFSKNFKVIAVDSRGQGKSTDGTDSLSYDAMAEDLNQLLNQLTIDSAYIIGHSDGAIVGLITAFRYPQKVKMLAAMSPNIRPDSAVLYPEVEVGGLATYNRYEDSFKNGLTKLTPKLKLLRLMQYHPHISNSELGAIKAPVLLMSGDRDVIRLTHIIEIFRALPASNLCVFPGATHNAPGKNAGLYNEAIHRFFTTPFKMPGSW